MSVIGFDRPADARTARALVGVIGALGMAKFALLVIELSLVGHLVRSPDATVVQVTLLVVVGLGASWAVLRHQRTGAAAIAAAAAALGLMTLAPVTASHHFHLVAVLLVLASFVDDRAGGEPAPGATVAGWPLALMRCQLTIVYAFTALSKVNADFLSGLVAHELLGTNVLGLSLPGGLDRSLPFLATCSVLLVVGEVVLALAVWSRRARPIAFAVALPMHAGMTLLAAPDLVTVVEIAIFTTGMGVLYASFVEVPPGGLRLLHDGGSARARRLVRLLRRLDVSGATTFVDARPGSAGAALDGATRWEAVRADGSSTTGWRAVQVVLASSPATFAVAPWLAFPPVRRWATRALGPSDRAVRPGAPEAVTEEVGGRGRGAVAAGGTPSAR